MSYALLEPSLLFVTEATWKNEELRDEYLQHFSSIISSIDNNDEIDIAWTALMDELMWESPQQLPWIQDKTWSRCLIPIIYKKLSTNVDYINPSSTICTVTPSFIVERYDFYSEFCKLIPELYSSNYIPYICLGQSNIPSKAWVFEIDNAAVSPSPKYIISGDCFFKEIVIENDMWPANVEGTDLFKQAVLFKIKRDFENKTVLYNFDFSSAFIKVISKVNNDRDKILTSVARRLILNSFEAGKDPCLQDEALEGKKKERRLRVTPRPSSKRIHYEKDNSNLLFTAFFDAGEHDKGL